MTESINASDDKIELTERLLQPEHVMDFMKQAQYDKNYGNPDRIKFDFYPEVSFVGGGKFSHFLNHSWRRRSIRSQ